MMSATMSGGIVTFRSDTIPTCLMIPVSRVTADSCPPQVPTLWSTPAGLELTQPSGFQHPAAGCKSEKNKDQPGALFECASVQEDGPSLRRCRDLDLSDGCLGMGKTWMYD